MGLLDKILGGGASSVIDSVSNVVDKFVTTGAEKEAAKLEIGKVINSHLEIMTELANKEMDSARNREIQIATSDKAPLINKIIQPILAILILGSCFLFWYMMLFTNIPKEKEVMIAGITGSLTTLSMGVVSYYFGSSTGSKAKQEQIDKMTNKN